MKKYDLLLRQIDDTLGRPVCTPQDFMFLSESIYSKTHQIISVSTLKRIYGYVSSKSKPRRTTLDILSLYVGFLNWDTFCRQISDSVGEK